jgi:hypothetical protein
MGHGEWWVAMGYFPSTINQEVSALIFSTSGLLKQATPAGGGHKVVSFAFY